MSTSYINGLQRLGRFEILDPLRSDAHQSEYVGRDTSTGGPVMVKMYHRDPDEGTRFRRYHRRELENQKEVSDKLDHPGILRVLEIAAPDEPDYIVTEHVDGLLPLTQLIAMRDQLELPRALKIACAIATVVDHAHRHNVVHCDLQPRNILVAPDDSIKLTGFALATQLDADEQTRLQSFSSALYVAPEQLLQGEITPQTDLFSLGVVICELLTGVHPFMSNVVPTISHKIVSKAHTPMSHVRAEIPAVLDRIIDRALKKHPAGRYRSTMDLSGDLGLVLDELRPPPEQVPDEVRLRQLQGVEFFAEFTSVEMLEILKVSLWITFEPGEVVVQEGDKGSSFFIVVEGKAQVRKGEVLIDTLTLGTCFGEIGFVTQDRRSATVVADTELMVMEVRASLIRRIPVTAQLRFQSAFLEIMAARLTRATQRIADLSK